MLQRTDAKITEVRVLGVKPMQINTVGELSKFLSFLDPNTRLDLDGLFPTLVKRPGGLSIERWDDSEIAQGHMCAGRCN
jgi:hypothetical protein